nr:hypothetical protein [Bradyrhizobium diazoefficiens]
MRRIRLAIAATVAVGLAAAPFGAEAKGHRSSRHSSRHISTSGLAPTLPTYGGSAVTATQPRAYGTSGQSVGTVTAPSIGTYNWPSVGVTNAVPTWSNTNPPAR